MTSDNLQSSRTKLNHPGQITLVYADLSSVLQHSHFSFSFSPEGRELTSDVTVLERTASLWLVCLPSLACLLLHTVKEMPRAFSAEWGFPENDKATFPFLTIPNHHLPAQCYSLESGCPLNLGLQPRMLLEGGDLVENFIGVVV